MAKLSWIDPTSVELLILGKKGCRRLNIIAQTKRIMSAPVSYLLLLNSRGLSQYTKLIM